MRVKLRELTLRRLVEAFLRRVSSIQHTIDWYFSTNGKVNRQRLLSFKNQHQGERCFIIANGLSLKNTDLSLLKDEVTFCMNRIYLMFDELNFIPNYYVVNNELILEQFSDDISNLSPIKFLNWNRRSYFSGDKKSNFLRYFYSLNEKLSEDPLKGVYSGGTVTHACLQLAYFMGFSEVYIVGMDHNFVDTGVPSKTEVRTQEVDKNHFHPNYFPKGSKWQLPDLDRCEIVYKDSLTRFNSDGRYIFDATIDGKCTIFPKVDYKSLFSI
jgi:hypothetical protein